MIQDKLRSNHTYLEATNYWTPLDNDEEDNNDDKDEINMIKELKSTEKQKGNKWTRRRARRQEQRMIIDSGATSHFVSEEMNLPQEGKSNKQVYLPNDATLHTSTKTKLPFPNLSDAAREADILPGLKRSLLSVNKMSEEGYTTIFHPGEEGVTFHEEGTVQITMTAPPILHGQKLNGEKLWTVSGKQSKYTHEEVNNVYSLPSIQQSVKYLHAAAGFPVKDEWLDAIKAGNYVTWPGLTLEAVRKHCPDSDETQKGHMKKQRQGVRSTKIKDENNIQHTVPPPKKMRDVYIKIFNAEETMHSDQTGRFPATSSRGNKYLMVLVEVDGNYIDAEPLKNKSEGAMINAYLALWQRLTAKGTVKPTTHILDNEASAAFKAEIKKNCTIQLVPPDNHRRNLAERAIQTFKNHFKAVLAGVDDNFPMHLWDRLIPQTILTLNLLRQSHVAPTVSAYQYVHGTFDYNKMPLAPMGCAVQIHERSEKRGSWAMNSVDGWYLRTSDEHYRCHEVYVKRTRGVRISDTVHFKHRHITNPTLTPEDTIVRALTDLTEALRERRNTKGEIEYEALQKFDELLNNIPLPQTPSTQPTPTPRRVTFDVTATPEVEMPPIPRVRIETQTPRVHIETPIPRVQEPREQEIIPPPRVQTVSPNLRVQSSPPTITAATIDKPIRKTVMRIPTPAQTKLRNKIGEARNLRSRLGMRTHMQLRQHENQQRHSERIQLIRDDETGEYLNYRQLMRHPKHKTIWSTSSANEFGRLAQGVGGTNSRVVPTNTIFFIKSDQVPADRKKDVTYGSFTCVLRPLKKETHRTRLTMGGDRINYPGDVGTPTADMTLVKIFFNSVISTKGAKCVMLDIKDFYLNTPMARYEYMRLKLTDIPEEIIVEYKLRDIATPDGYVYIEVRKGMYGLPQAGIIAQQLLEERLAKVGYHQSQIVPGLWTHETRDICFTLVVDDFAIKYTKLDDAQHLINALKQDYNITVDWEATTYIGLTVEWDYINRKVHIHMPGYLDSALLRFKHERPRTKQNSPHRHVAPQYGAKAQYVENNDTSPPLGKESTKYIQAVTGTLLYYARAVDSTILPALSAIATEQAKPTEKTLATVKQLLDYCATQDEPVMTYHASKMILAVHSDAGYCNETNSRSRAGGHFFLSDDVDNPPNNGAILTIATIIKAVMSSAAEAELGALFLNAKEAVYLRQILTEMGHPQPRTPIQTDNSTAEGVINSKIQPKRTKAMDMRFHWLRDREAQGQFRIYWRPGKTNLADYFTKHHPPMHHVNIRSEFLTKVKDLAEARRQRNELGQTKSKFAPPD